MQRKLLATVLFAVSFLASEVYAQPVVEPHSRRLDRLGDPLPPNALLQMGTRRFRSPGAIMQMVLSADGKTLVTVGEFFNAWDASTGRKLWELDANFVGGQLSTSYGCQQIAICSGDVFGLPNEQCVGIGPLADLVIVDVLTGEMRIPTPRAMGASDQTGPSVRSVHASRDGKRFVMGTPLELKVCDADGNETFLIKSTADAPAQHNARDRLHFGGAFNYAVLAPDTRSLAHVQSGNGRMVVLRDASSGKELGKINCEANVVRMAFSPDGKRLAVTERDTAVRLYETSTQKIVWEIKVKVNATIENYTSAIQFSPDGKKIVVCERQQQILLLDAENGDQIGSFKNPSTNPWSIVFSPNGETLYASGWGGSIHRWDVKTQKKLPIPNAALGTAVVAASTDGNTLAHVDQDKVIHLVSKNDGAPIRQLSLSGTSYQYLAFSPDCQFLAGGGQHKGKLHVAVWNYQSGELKHRWEWEKGKDAHCGVNELQFSPDSNLLAATSHRQDAVHLWNVSTGKKVSRMKHKDVYGLHFYPDGNSLVSAGWDHKLRFWATDSGQLIETFSVAKGQNAEFDDSMYTVSGDPSGDVIATTHLNDRISFWNADDRKARGDISTKGFCYFGATCFSPDGLWFATGGDGTIEIWDPWSVSAHPQPVHTIQAHKGNVYTIAFSGDNRTLVSGGGNIAYLWDLRPKPSLMSLDAHVSNLLSSDGVTTYAAWWAVVDSGQKSDDVVEMLRAKTASVKKVLNAGRMASGRIIGERIRRYDLLNQLADSKPDTLRLSAAKRLVSALSHIDSDASIKLLNDLATQSGALSKVAAFELKRRQ